MIEIWLYPAMFRRLCAAL